MHEFDPYNRLKFTRHGWLTYNCHDRYVGRSVDLYGEFSEGEVELFRRFVGPGDTVLDVGANIGAHALFFARRVGPGGRVLAFEPQRLVFQALCANMAVNSVTNAWCFPHAVGAAPGAVTVPHLDVTRENNFGGLALGGATSGEEVPVVTLDALAVTACRLVKVDVEGMEAEVLRGAAGLLRRCRPVLYVENDRADRAAALIRAVDALGYEMYWHCPPLFNPANHAGNPVNVFGNTVSRNMLCLPRGSNLRAEGLAPVDPAAPQGSG